MKVRTSLATADPPKVVIVACSVEVLVPLAGIVDGFAVTATVFGG
jgi:hypothetical protein